VTGHMVKLTLGSSGDFQGGISNGAPFDVYLSADVDYVPLAPFRAVAIDLRYSALP
jgi:ABC-type molybdate transport system substrate-binding protein